MHYNTVGHGYCPAPAAQEQGLGERQKQPLLQRRKPLDHLFVVSSPATVAGTSTFDLQGICTQLDDDAATGSSGAGRAAVAAAVAEGAGQVALGAEFKDLKLSELKRRARAAGVAAAELDAADDATSARCALGVLACRWLAAGLPSLVRCGLAFYSVPHPAPQGRRRRPASSGAGSDGS